VPHPPCAIVSAESQSRYVVHYYPNGALLRIEPVKLARDNANYECLAENGVGDAVSAEATLIGHEGKCQLCNLQLSARSFWTAEFYYAGTAIAAREILLDILLGMT